MFGGKGEKKPPTEDGDCFNSKNASNIGRTVIVVKIGVTALRLSP